MYTWILLVDPTVRVQGVTESREQNLRTSSKYQKKKIMLTNMSPETLVSVSYLKE
jgi:hypothetical protein